jgi:3',5'-cyclic AMP phosphodiesterase CpdA
VDVLTTVDPLWDLRHGDADDNRTSPQGRGWRSMFVSGALEFNYLTAAIAFVLLVIGPALLVGLVPPLVATYGIRAVGPNALAGRHPVIALLVLGLLMVAAVRFGTPLLATIADSFWHLHYTLIVPLFVGLRELISAGMERFPGQTMTPEQLDRRRRLGTAIAALLLAGGGLVLAWALEFSTGARLMAVTDARLWAVALAALRNAVVVLGLSSALASLYWFWREISSGRPVRDWRPTPRAAGSPVVRVAHLSDPHVVGERYGFRMEAGTAGPRGNGRVRRAISELAAIDAATPLDRILLTGDITDAGTRAEWLEFMGLLRQCPSLRHRLLFVPGNHDVNVIDRTNPGRLDLPHSAAQALRKLRVVLALDRIQGECVRVVDRASGTLGPSLRDYLRQGERPALLRGLAERGTRRERREMTRVWDAIFPLIAPPPERGGIGVILLDSNALRHFSLTNAIGVIGRSQLRALSSVLRSSPDSAWLIALHHPIVEYPIPLIALHERIGLALANAPDLLAAIAAHGAPVVVLHGHRHRDWIGTRGDVTLCSAPSVTLGSYNTDSTDGAFHVYELAPGAGGALRLIATEQVTVA